MTLATRRGLLGASFCGLSALALSGCEELRTPPARGALPPEVAPEGNPAPQEVMRNLADAFVGQGQRLGGQVAGAARAVAQLEYATDLLENDPRFAPVSNSVRVSMRLARDEVRHAIGIRPEAPPRPVIRALAELIRAMRDRNRAQAAGTLTASLFIPGGQVTLARLLRPGPLPAAEQATAQLRAEIQRLDAQGGWTSTPGALNPAAQELGAGAASSLTPGLGRGY